MAFIKAFLKVFWLILQPFDSLQNAWGALGMIINFLIVAGVVSGSGVLTVYNPSTNQNYPHNWLLVALVTISVFALFVFLAAWKLQYQKDKVNDINFAVEPIVNNHRAYLNVTNNAKEMTFRATVRIHDDIHHESEVYPLYWENYGESVLLGNGDMRQILVAQQTVWTEFQLPDIWTQYV